MILIKLVSHIFKLLFILTVIIAISPRISFSKDNLRNDNDTTEVDEDTTGNYAQSLLDDQNDENDRLDSIRENYYSYGLFGKIGYTSDMQYRGYQGAGAQSAFIPGLFYNHPLGFVVLLNVYNIKGTNVPWDELEVGASYTRTFFEKFSVGLSYTHYTFYDTSEISQQGINGIAGLNLGYDFSILSAGTSFNISFGDQTDYSISFDLSKRIDIAKSPDLRCWLEPGFSGIYGTESLLNERIILKKNPKKIMVNNVITTANNVFSVLAYQLSIPLTVELSRFIITPKYDYVIPLNQPQFTDSRAFGFFTINVSVKIF
jgi:hypothetical protein